MKTLLVGYRAADLFEKGKHGRRSTAAWLDGDVTCHTLDIYDRHAIEKTHHARAICSPHLPEGPWDLVKFRTGPKLMSGELALSLLQEIHLLKPARFEMDFVGRERDRNDLLAKVKDDPDRVRDFSATWKASVPGVAPIELVSFPGCFCHRRQDEGGLALAEVASREAGAIQTPDSRPLSVLDMGCGCGLVGFLIAASLGSRPLSLVMVDSHSRAVEAARLNSERLGIPAEVVLADNGTPARMDGTFDVFVGNPPYYSDYRIADVFLETAKRALRPGGVCYTVCKNAAGLEPVQKRYFPDVEIVKRRGYAVLKSVKEVS
ncbi:MAG: methyltransferase [Kiritimatiellae bacterium]|nr:methyltransferase [Kiritimatiellia bacterium]